MLYGLRGEAEFTITVCRFDRGAPKQETATHTWTYDEGRGRANFLPQAQLASDGWLTPDNKIRLLVTVHLKRGP